MTSLTPWSRSSLNPLEAWRRELENTFERFFGESALTSGEVVKTWAPRVDVEESDKEILVKADVPGVDPKDVEIAVHGDTLTLRGEKKEQKEEKKKNYHRVERFVGQFYREIPLPAGADAEKVTATSAKGVITIIIPKKPELQPRKVTVKAQD